MSTWQPELYVQVQVRVQVLQNSTQVQVPSTASEAITISTILTLSVVNIFAVSDNENLWLLRHVLCIPSV